VKLFSCLRVPFVQDELIELFGVFYFSYAADDAYEATVWRAHFLRNLYPSPSAASGSKASTGIIQETLKSIQSECTLLAGKLLCGPCKFLLADRPLSQQDEALQQLQQCYMQAGKLFTRLHAQPLELRWQQESLLKEPYDPRCMRLHSLQGMYDDGEVALAGRRVTIVVSPSLHKIRRQDGTPNSHVLVRAVVCADV
jgi:hypothetical protein